MGYMGSDGIVLGRVASPARPRPEIEQIRQDGMRFNARRTQGAPREELDELAATLKASLRNGLSNAPNDELREELVDAFFDMITSESDPRLKRPAP